MARRTYDNLLEVLRLERYPFMLREAPECNSDGISDYQPTVASERGHLDEKPGELSSVYLDPILGPPFNCFPCGFPTPGPSSSALKCFPCGFPTPGPSSSALNCFPHGFPTPGPSSSALNCFPHGFPRPTAAPHMSEYALSDAKGEKNWHAREIAIWHERNALKAALEERVQDETRRSKETSLTLEERITKTAALETALEDETRRSKETRLALEERIGKVAILEAERDAALADAKRTNKQKRRKVNFMKRRSIKRTQQTLQAFDAIVITLQHQQQKLEAENKEFQRLATAQLPSRIEQSSLQRELEAARDSLQQATAQLTSRRIKQVRLQRELDASQYSLLHEKNRFDIELGNAIMERRKAEEHLETVKGQRDGLKRERDDAVLALDEQKAKVVVECDEKLRVTKLLTAAHCKKWRLEYDLIVAAEDAAEDRIKFEQAHKTAQQAWSESVKLLEAVTQKPNLEEKCGKLETARQAVQTDLEEEKDKSLCQICYDSPKDSIAFPCLHLNFCFFCLESHKAQKRTCPTCRTTISGVLKCVVCV